MKVAARPRGDEADGAPSTAFAIADFLMRTEKERLHLFRRHLHATVRQVSPLLVELSLIEGISLAAAVGGILPPRDWPWHHLPASGSALIGRTIRRRAWGGSKGRGEVARFRRAFAEPGLVIRDADHALGRFAIMPVDRTLGFTAALGPCILTAFGSTAMLKLPAPLPETLVISLPGRQLDGIVDHPPFRGAGYRVIRVEPDLVDGTPVIFFRAPPLPFEMPLPQSPRAALA